MNRREFIKSLLALGASVALPVDALPFDINTATDAEIDAAWNSGLFDFEVEDYGTISFADFDEPRTNAEAYGWSLQELQDPQSLRDFSDRNRLHCRLQGVYEVHLEGIPDDPEYGWLTWLETSPEEASGPLYAEVEQFLDESPDFCNDWEYLPDTANAQGAAYQYFLSEDQDVMERLGVVIVEGECPGSSYYAAELRMPVDEANQIAEELGIAYRFRAV